MPITQPNRREFLIAGAAGGLVLAGDLNYAALARAKRLPRAAHGKFLHGVASGFPHPNATTLWTRVSELAHSATVELEVARDKHFRRVVHRRQVLADAARDHTVHARVGGLKPDEQYFYRFATKHSHSRVGRFKTAPHPSSKRALRIGFYSCQSYEAGYYTAQAGLAHEDLDFVLCLGDYIYERHYYPGPAKRADHTGRNHDGDVQTLAEFRQKYRFYQRDPHLQDMHAAHAFVSIWDDHEVEDNYAGNEPDSKQKDPKFENDGKTPRRVPFTQKRRNGYQAYFEAMPRIQPRGARRNIVYNTLSLGGLADLVITDQRQYRDPQPCDDALLQPCPADADAGRTLLGPGQREWFKNAVVRSRKPWKLWASEVMVMSLDSTPGNHANPDQWDGYAAERADILEHFVDRDVKNLVVLTGDIHTFLAGDVTTTGNSSGKAAGTELVGGSATSLGLPEETGISPSTLDSLRKTSDPHIKYGNFERRGYCVVEVGANELRAQFKAPQTTQTPRSPIETIGRFRVASGVPKLEVE